MEPRQGNNYLHKLDCFEYRLVGLLTPSVYFLTRVPDGVGMCVSKDTFWNVMTEVALQDDETHWI